MVNVFVVWEESNEKVGVMVKVGDPCKFFDGVHGHHAAANVDALDS